MVPHLLLSLLISISSLSGTESAAALKLTNRCPQTIWPEILSGATTPPLPALPAAGSPLGPGKSRTVPVPTGWSGRIWGRTHCVTSAADCGGQKVELSLHGAKLPATVLELTLDGAGVKATAAREDGRVACSNDTSSTSVDTDYYGIVFCPRPHSSREVVGRRRGRAALPLVNETTMATTTTWRSRNPNAAFSSAAAIHFAEPATSSSSADHQELSGGDNATTTTTTMTMMMEPVKTVELRMMLNDKRRRLNSFQMCSLCTCCSGGRGGSGHYCLLSPCCYAINCNIPNKPFGFCAFIPKSCNCFGCG